MPHLPFRRISIPTVPSLVNRQSIVSVVSIDSTPEDCIATGMAGPISKSGGVARKKAGHNAHEDNARKSRRKELLKPISEARDTKRRQVVSEFLETERAYVHGLDLIYSVSLCDNATAIVVDGRDSALSTF
jgi:FYVE/RhoGEF/PH domain-containing protein 5/6